MDFVKAVSAYGLVKDLRLNDEDSKLSTILDLVGFGSDESSMLLAAARAVAPTEDMRVMEFVEAKGFGAAMNMLMKQSESEDVQKLGNYLALADLNISSDEEAYVTLFAPIGVDADTATTVRKIVQENATPGESVAQFMKSPAFGRMVSALQQGLTSLPPTAGIIECPHCEGLIKP